MKPARSVIALAVGLSCAMLSSCDSEDPSAKHEIQKAINEARAQNRRLEGEIAALKSAPPKEDPKLKADHEKELAQLKDEHAKEVARLKSELAQTTTKLKEALAAARKAEQTIANTNSDRTPQATPERRPTPPQPPVVREKPKPKYDIDFNQPPVMGPGSR